MARVDLRERFRSRLATVSRLSRWPRRLLAVGLLGAAALLATRPDRPAANPPVVPGVRVLVAARDLDPGRALSAAAVRVVALPESAVPRGALRPGDPVAGRRLAAPVRRGEPLTDVRFAATPVDPVVRGRGAVSVPVRLADADAAGLVHPGDRVDVLVAPDNAASGPAAVLARDLTVLAVPHPSAGSATDGALVVLSAPEDIAGRLAGAAAGSRVTLVGRPP